MHEVLQNPIDDVFVEDPNRSKCIDIKLERLQFDAELVWYVVDLDSCEVRKIGERTDRRKLRTRERDVYLAAFMLVLKGIELRKIHLIKRRLFDYES